MISENLVGIEHDPDLTSYPQNPPFSPATRHPEYPFEASSLLPGERSRDARIYDRVRALFLRMGLDAVHFGDPDWNPLGELIRPGDLVLIKPNLVHHVHGWGWDTESMVTHGSVLRPVLDYAWIALKGQGRIVVGDAPLQTADFDLLAQRTGIRAVVDFAAARGVPVELLDFRAYAAEIGKGGQPRAGRARPGDPLGSVAVDLAGRSWLVPLDDGAERFRVTCYDPGEMQKHHSRTVHEYLITRTALQAQVVINLPKMKTHRKVGLTCALKNLVGINAHKDWLPHHRQGSIVEGGDEYRDRDPLKAAWSWMLDRQNAARGRLGRPAASYAQRGLGKLSRVLHRDPYTEGSWYGNDTAWRMALDLNRILLYASASGEIRDSEQRRVFTVVDGVVAGEGEGPLEPARKAAGVLLAGRSSAAVDAVAARLMGFDYRKIPLVRECFAGGASPLAAISPHDIRALSDDPRWQDLDLETPGEHLGFRPPDGWKGHIELTAEVGRRR